MRLSKVQSRKSEVRCGEKMSRKLLRLVRRPSEFGDRNGVALVITLIMLSIITFMAVTFLVLSQRERSSVNGDTDQKTARNASDAALARVCTELLTHMFLHTNFQDFDLLVSTNYINNQGLFNGTPGVLNPTNVNYDYLVDGTPITAAQDRNINVASLLFNPRPPVFVVTNTGTGQGEFRYYYDLNRNGRFDPNGNRPIVFNNGGTSVYMGTNASGPITLATNLPVPVGTWIYSNNFVGDPEWIGVLERPAELHSPDNRFIARYAYLVVPVGKTLDINYIHNRTKRLTLNGEGFLRNQGAGTWEINLAGFLADLNTNVWWTNNNYFYTSNNVASSGWAFRHANDLLAYRYGPRGYLALNSANVLFPSLAAGLNGNNMDLYSDGPLLLTVNTNEDLPADNLGSPWPGADNTNHYFSTQDFFDRTKTQNGEPPGSGFSDFLQNLGTSNDSYNASTFYRLLSQLGTDTTPDQGKIDVNFKNTDIHGTIIPGMETNLIAWTPLDFFTNAADAMFRQLDMHDFNGNLITVTNIPFYGDPAIFGTTNINYYTPAVHRILQLAANMYDATTNRFFGNGPTNYPSVFRPVFRSANGVASIAGYREVTENNFNPSANYFFVDAQNFVKLPQTLNSKINIYGIPWIIGAKKGLPNFNNFSMENDLTVSRDLQFTNTTGTATVDWTTNQLFGLSITNSFGFQGWNSYTNRYGRSLLLMVSNEMSIMVTNQFGNQLFSATNVAFGTNMPLLNGWSGWTRQLSDFSFVVPLALSRSYTNGIYLKNGTFVPLNPTVWGPTFVPRLTMLLQLKVRYVLVDTSVNRVLDYVNLLSTQPAVDVTSMLNGGANGQQNSSLDEQWDTNLVNGIPFGILNQISASEGMWQMSDWNDSKINILAAQANFRKELNNYVTNNFQAPYSPHKTVYQRISWQANDPLVHYTVPDLTSTNGTLARYNGVFTTASPPLTNLTSLNFAYQPWGGYHLPGGSPQQTIRFDYDWRLKDPGVEQSDNWDFPTNKLPSIGWLGRVHRGTPWQTVYMKYSDTSAQDWKEWANDNVLITNGNTIIVDGPLTHPRADYGLFDQFTAAVNENASYGRLNVNQTNLAAWSAVLSGVNVLSNTPVGSLPMVINPAGYYDPSNPTPVAAIVQGINAARANTNSAKGTVLVFPNGTFQHAGDVLATPQLSIASPFLDTKPENTQRQGINSLGANGITDELMERIPQQVMSLLTLNQNPRFVIYSFGQTLHPADHSLVIGGTFNGLCTNYQITAESATRAVVHVEGTSDPFYVNGKVDSMGRSYPPHIVVEQFNVLGPD